MGNSTSSHNNKKYEQECQQLLVIAQKNYNTRVKNYNYKHHGNYDLYIDYCQAQYELECIPKICRRGAVVAYEEDGMCNDSR